MITSTPVLLTLKTPLVGFWDTWQAGKILTLPPGLQKPGESLARVAEVYSTKLPVQLGLWKAHGHSRCAKFESLRDLGFRLKKKWHSKGGPIPWRRYDERRPDVF